MDLAGVEQVLIVLGLAAVGVVLVLAHGLDLGPTYPAASGSAGAADAPVPDPPGSVPATAASGAFRSEAILPCHGHSHMCRGDGT